MKILKVLLFVSLLIMGIFGTGFVFAQNEIDNSTADATVDDTSDGEIGTDEAEIEAEVKEEAESEIDEATTQEVELMDISHGARMRLLQLEWRMRRAVFHMEAVIDVVKDKNSNSTNLEAIVEEMRLLVEEVQAIPDSDLTKEEAVYKFVEIKHDAKDLIKKFRETARELLTADDKTALKEKFSEIDGTELKELREKIKETKRMLNAERVRKVLGLMEIENSELAEKIESGEISPKDAIRKLRTHYNSLTDEKKNNAKEKVKEEHIKRRVKREDRVLKANEVRLDRKSQRLEKRSDMLTKAGFESAGERLNKKAKKLETRLEKVEDKRAELRDKAKTTTKTNIRQTVKVRGTEDE